MTHDIDDDLYDDDDDDPRCTVCDGEIWVECDDPIQCCTPRCDGELHPDPACGGTGRAEHQVIWLWADAAAAAGTARPGRSTGSAGCSQATNLA